MSVWTILRTLGLAAVLAASMAARAEVWVDTDWSGGHWTGIDQLDADTAPGELVLRADSLRFVPLLDATDYDGIWDLAVWQDRLYLAAGNNPPMMSDGGDILVYDYRTNGCSVDYAVFEQGIAVLKVHDGVIYSPGIDSQGTHLWGNLYYNDGTGWIRRETLPYSVHVYDIIFHDGRIWVTTGQGFPDTRGVLFSSGDMGQTWVEEFAVVPQPPESTFRRLYGAATFGGSIVLQPDFEAPEERVLLELPPDGAVIAHDILAHTSGLAGFQEYRGRLWCLLRYALNAFDGTTWTGYDVPAGSPDFVSRAITVFRDRLYIGGLQNICATEDAQTWRWSQIESNDDRVFETLESFHGRLFVGSQPHGELYVTAVPGQGELVSQPYCFAAPAGPGEVSWQALLQGQATAVSFQIRSAGDEAALEAAQFLGPDGTGTDWYMTSGTALASAHHGDTCFQYRVRLTSDDERFAPVLQEFRLEIDGVIAASGAIPAPLALTVQPNPFNPRATLHYTLPIAAEVALSIFDLQGRRVADLERGTRAAGRHAATWDGRDGTGRGMPAGTYLARLVAGERVATKRLVLVR